MTDTTTAHAPPAEERRLVRAADDRVIAGVCGGLGRYFGVNPLVYRVALAALVLLGGAGLIVYAAAWLVIPDERRGESVVEEAIRDRRRRPWLAVGVGLVGLALLLAIAWTDLVAHPGDEWLVVLAVGLALVWWQLRDHPAEPLHTGTPEHAADASMTTPGTGRPAEPSPRRRFPVFLPTIGVLLTGAGVLGLLEATDTVDVNWTIALASGVVMVGIAVVVGAFLGGVAWLAVVGAVLATVLVGATAIKIPLEGPIGDRTEHPVSVRELRDAYRQSIGQLELELQDLALPRGTTEVAASVGIGQLTVVVPDGVRVEIHTHLTIGEAKVFDEKLEGRGFDRVFVDESAGVDTPKLVVDADVGLGELVVRRR